MGLSDAGIEADASNPMCTVPVTTSGACNDIVDDATAVAQVQVAEDEPPAVGGTPQDGLYHLTALYVFTGDGGATGPTGYVEQHTSRVQDDCFYSAGAIDGGEEKKTVTSALFSDNTITEMLLCPTGSTTPEATRRYSILDGGIEVFLDDSHAEVLTRVGD
jgi:hypothetical protein